LSKRPDTYDALADPTRRRILEILRDSGERTAGDLAASFPKISRPAVSRHLRVLREARVVRARQEGREWIYALDPRALERVYVEYLRSFAPLWDAALQQLKRRAEGDED
jgi:DNA-binding transcriptional ArsR family regulator